VVHAYSYDDLTPWHPKRIQVPPRWMAFVQKEKEQTPIYVLDVKYNAQYVGELLHAWGLPWHVVVAGLLLGCNEEQIRDANLDDVELVLSHISAANLYARYIEDENLPHLLTPPHQDMGALLIAVAIYYQALREIQKQSNDQPYTGETLLHIESVGTTLRNIAARHSMWYFRREIEDLIEQLNNPRRFAAAQQEHKGILERDASKLEDIRQVMMTYYQEATHQPIMVVCTPCGVMGMRRRRQDAHTTVTSHKTQLTGFDLVTFDILVPLVRHCYEAFGILSQLGTVQDRVTELIANPKPNGCSHIAFGLVLKPNGAYTRQLQWLKTDNHICQIQISTHLMHALIWYGCIHPDYYALCMQIPSQEEIHPLPSEQFWNSEEGNTFFALKEGLAAMHVQPETATPIVVYDKHRNPVPLPKGATALDFAFALSPKLGEHAVETFINNRKAPLYRIVDAGDIVEIRTSDEIQTQEYWLEDNYVTTSEARRLIKESISQRFLDRRGYHLLLQELEHRHYPLKTEKLEEELYLMLKQHGLGTPKAYLERLDKMAEPPYTPDWAAEAIIQQIIERNEQSSTSNSGSIWFPILDAPLTVTKKVRLQQRLCGFCKPTYPHTMKIMGLLRERTNELVVHKASCPHLNTIRQGSTLQPMSWQPRHPTLHIAFVLTARDRKGLIFELTKELRRYQCELVSMNAEVSKDGEARIRFTLEMYTDAELRNIWQELHEIADVSNVHIDATNMPASMSILLQTLLADSPLQPHIPNHALTWAETLSGLPPRNLILKNLFDISRPAESKMFFGRSEETKMMQRELCEEQRGKGLILYGPLRSGKSSICKNFLENHVHPPFWSTLFSLQNVIRQPAENVFRELSDKVSETFSEQLQRSAPNWHFYSESDPQARFRHILQDTIDQVPGTRLVLALDEFGSVLHSYEHHVLDHRFFTYWKELMSEFSQLSLIFAMPTSSHKLLSKEFAHSFSFAESLPVVFLDPESAGRLLTLPLREQHIAVQPSTVALAVKLTGGNPYYMTLIGQLLTNQLNREKEKQVVTDEDLRLIVNLLIGENSHQHFSFLSNELQSHDEFHVLEAIVNLTNDTNPKVQLKKIAARLSLPAYTLRGHLDRLRIGLILEENGPTSNPYYSFRIELIRRWLARNHWFFSLVA